MTMIEDQDSSKSRRKALGVTSPLKLPTPVQEVSDLPSTAPIESGIPWVIGLRIVGTSETFATKVRDSLLIGRVDYERGINPDIDLNNYGGAVLGVSRRHAMINVNETRLEIEDLGSTNGTRVNGILLAPGKPYPLYHGDEVMLGGLQLQIQFTVVPPEADKPKTAPLIEPTAPNVDGSGRTVLLIEDDADTADVFRAALEQSRFKVTHVRTVTQGLGLCFYHLPDAIVLNMMTSDMNGLDLVRYVRKQDPFNKIAVVALSPATGGYHKNLAFQAGADAFLPTPVGVQELLGAIAEAIV